MKKFLSVLVALLLIVSIPASAAAKPTVKDKYTGKGKSIKVSISEAYKDGKYTLTAKTNKQGLNVLEGNVLGQHWTATYKSDLTAQATVYNNFIVTKNAVKNNPVSTLEFTPDSPGIYTFSYTISMGAGKSKTKFSGTAAYSVFVSKGTEKKLSTYKFIIDKPDYIQPATNISIPVTLRSDIAGELGYNKVLVKVECTKPVNGVIKLLNNGDDVAALGYWGPINGFAISNNYNVTTNFTAYFSIAGNYSVKLTLVDLSNNNAVIASSTANIKVGLQSNAVKDLNILGLAVLPLENSNNVYKLYVTKLAVAYENTTSEVTLDQKYYIGNIKLSDLDNAGYEKSFYVTYAGFTKYFTLTGKQIQDLL